jgi:UDP-N-acetylglucosamine 2-epimerase (non-hydrolysing)
VLSRKISIIVGARPNFMKAAPLLRELEKYPDRLEPVLIHTGQHYDANLSQLFFDELKMPRPDVYLGVGSSTHAQQTATIMVELEKIWMVDPPDLAVVFGDVNSTMATALVTAKLLIKLAHVEAGLRSFDHTMPEEINRIVTDRLSDLLFVSEESGLRNLANEGVPSDRVFHTGNIMIDSLVHSLEACKKTAVLDDLSLTSGEYAVMTMHRPSNVDDTRRLSELLDLVNEISHRVPVVFPCHPRTKKEMTNLGVLGRIDSDCFKIIDPIGYLDFLRLQSEAKFVLTDSGGIQEETTYLRIPCITMRENTERPATVETGSNVLTGPHPGKIRQAVENVLNGRHREGAIPKYWDGQAASRIAKIILERLGV